MMRFTTFAALATTALCGSAQAQIVGRVDFDGVEMNLTGFSCPTYTYSGPGFGTSGALSSGNQFGVSSWTTGDACFPLTRADVTPYLISMPFTLSDDSVTASAGSTVFAADVLGVVHMAQDTDGFFGITDTENGQNAGPILVTFTFDITGATNLSARADFAAMGDFEVGADIFDFDYEIDGGGFQPLFVSSVDDLIDQTYTMDNVATNPVTLNDPVFINGNILTNQYQTIAAPIAGTGSSLTIRVTIMTDGGEEGFAFDNLTIESNLGGGGFTDACSGDGGNQTGCTDCPCGNNASIGTIGGCLNSNSTSARLFGSGTPSVANDTLRFTMTGGNLNTFAVLTSGDNIAPNNIANPCFGLNSGIQASTLDGLRCSVGNVQRHGSRSTSTMGEVGTGVAGPGNQGWGPPSGPAGGLIAASGFTAGQTRHWQVIYREDPMLGCMRGQNTSQSVSVTIVP